MERRTSAKLYSKVLSHYPQYKEEIDHLPHKFYEVISRYPYKEEIYDIEKEDFFSNLVLYCYEADSNHTHGTFCSRTYRLIDAMLSEQRQETRRLYNPHRNLYLDKCYGESKTPLGEWMNFSTDDD